MCCVCRDGRRGVRSTPALHPRRERSPARRGIGFVRFITAWRRDLFLALSFFSRLPGPRFDGNRVIVENVASDAPPRIKYPEKDEYIVARFLDGTDLNWKPGSDPRAVSH